MQYSLGEGPCLDVVKGDYFIVAGDLRDDERWVRFGPKAADLGMRSLLAVCLTGEPVVVALNLYSTDRDAFVEPLDDLWLVASFARVLLGYAQPSGLTDALLGTCVTGAATVLVTRHFGIDRCAAFEVMLRAARDHDMALIELARAIVAAPPPV